MLSYCLHLNASKTIYVAMDNKQQLRKLDSLVSLGSSFIGNLNSPDTQMFFVAPAVNDCPSCGSLPVLDTDSLSYGQLMHCFKDC